MAWICSKIGLKLRKMYVMTRFLHWNICTRVLCINMLMLTVSERGPLCFYVISYKPTSWSAQTLSFNPWVSDIKWYKWWKAFGRDVFGLRKMSLHRDRVSHYFCFSHLTWEAVLCKKIWFIAVLHQAFWPFAIFSLYSLPFKQATEFEPV